MTEYKHTSQNGKETLLKDLALPHLKNIIAKAERRAEQTGLRMFDIVKDSGVDKDNFTGKKFLKLIKYEKYKMYVDELNRRQDNE